MRYINILLKQLKNSLSWNLLKKNKKIVSKIIQIMPKSKTMQQVKTKIIFIHNKLAKKAQL